MLPYSGPGVPGPGLFIEGRLVTVCEKDIVYKTSSRYILLLVSLKSKGTFKIINPTKSNKLFFNILLGVSARFFGVSRHSRYP